MSPEGVKQYEAAVEMLLAEGAIRQRWDPEEFWSVIGSLLTFVSVHDVAPDRVAVQIERLRNAAPSIVIVPVANIHWFGPPAVIADVGVFGGWDNPTFASAASELSSALAENAADVANYLQAQPHRRPMTGFAAIVPSQGSKAFKQATKRLQQLCDLALLLVRDKEHYGLYSLRGAWNRPGVRGLTLDRSTAQSIMVLSEHSAELSARPLVLDELGASSTVHWYSADPFPMQRLLEDPKLLQASEQILASRVGVASRVQLAARWYAESFWASENDDAVLALGVSLDALIGSKSGLPGRVMRDRYALLEPDPSARQDRARRYDEVFGARSAIAHGGTSTRICERNFVRSIQDDVTWAAWRLLQVEKVFGDDLSRDLDRLFDQLRWGTLAWPPEEAGGCN